MGDKNSIAKKARKKNDSEASLKGSTRAKEKVRGGITSAFRNKGQKTKTRERGVEDRPPFLPFSPHQSIPVRQKEDNV